MHGQTFLLLGTRYVPVTRPLLEMSSAQLMSLWHTLASPGGGRGQQPPKTKGGEDPWSAEYETGVF